MQYAQWGIDYLKYDWHTNDEAHTAQMANALRASGRDIVYSLSNSAPFDKAAIWANGLTAGERPATSVMHGAKNSFHQVKASGHRCD